ncbi:MAG: hypothetical protein D6808_03305 [Candidatus Dadabacteria bacterium]|nr:MAG: hypothetical protein D6808_03305 [Candidatus Dadabacteria bacterium]
MGKKGKAWSLLFKGKIEDFDPLQALNYWKDKTTEEKFKETRSLIDQALKMQGRSYEDVSRLLRSTAVLKRQ